MAIDKTQRKIQSTLISLIMLKEYKKADEMLKKLTSEKVKNLLQKHA